MLDENVGRVPGQHVPQHAAAHAGNHAHKHQQEQGGAGRVFIGDADARHSENAKARGVHNQRTKS